MFHEQHIVLNFDNSSPLFDQSWWYKLCIMISRRTSHFGPNFQAPNALLIAPAPIHKIDSADFNLFFDDSSIANTKELATFYTKLADQEGCPFLDAGQIVKVSDDDGVHIEAESHKKLANAIAHEIKKMISKKT